MAGNTTEQAFFALQRCAFDRREEQWMHVPCNIELGLLEIIKRGEPENIARNFSGIFPPPDGHLSPTPLRQAVYEFIACIALTTRFAVEGGLTVETAYTFSDAYIQSADAAKDVDTVHALCRKMPIGFAAKVKRVQASRRNLSMPLIRTIDYIDSHLHNKLTLSEIAGAVNRIPSCRRAIGR